MIMNKFWGQVKNTTKNQIFDHNVHPTALFEVTK